MQDFPSPSRAPWPSAYEGMISSRGVAKKRRTQELAGMRVKCSLSVATKQQSWQGGNHFLSPIPHCTLGAYYRDLFHLDVGGLDHRPPFLNFGLLPGAERLWRELILRRHLQSQIFQLLAHGRIVQPIHCRGVELCHDF